MQIAKCSNNTGLASRQSDALYEVSVDVGQLIDLLDTMADALDEEWANPAATLLRMSGVARIARSHAARTLEKLLAAEGAQA